jgi:hypothetical protein
MIKYVNKVSEHLLCFKCNTPVNGGSIHISCGAIKCPNEACIHPEFICTDELCDNRIPTQTEIGIQYCNHILSKKNKCRDIAPSNWMPVDRIAHLHNSLQALKIYCTDCRCKEIMEYKDLDSHLENTCLYRNLYCDICRTTNAAIEILKHPDDYKICIGKKIVPRIFKHPKIKECLTQMFNIPLASIKDIDFSSVLKSNNNSTKKIKFDDPSKEGPTIITEPVTNPVSILKRKATPLITVNEEKTNNNNDDNTDNNNIELMRLLVDVNESEQKEHDKTYCTVDEIKRWFKDRSDENLHDMSLLRLNKKIENSIGKKLWNPEHMTLRRPDVNEALISTGYEVIRGEKIMKEKEKRKKQKTKERDIDSSSSDSSDNDIIMMG